MQENGCFSKIKLPKDFKKGLLDEYIRKTGKTGETERKKERIVFVVRQSKMIVIVIRIQTGRFKYPALNGWLSQKDHFQWNVN